MSKVTILIFMSVFCFNTVAMVPQVSLADIIYVDDDANGDNNGTSWIDAYLDLQDALANAQVGDEIWIAKGVYKPGNDRENSFAMINGTAIYGGFNGTETALEERNPFKNETVLSGDIGIEGDNSDNCYHVFYHPTGTNLDSTAILDGFTITDGNANDEWSHSQGGGMYNYGSSPWVTNVIFSGNSAKNGGGIHFSSSNPRFTNVIIINNTAENGGAGMDNFGSFPTLSKCTFLSNTAGDFGGGMSNDLSSPTLINCAFFDNTAGDVGGGMSNYTYSSPTLTNCIFYGNSASNGGGIWNGYSSPTVINCISWGNTPNEVYGDTSIITYSAIQGGYKGEGNIDVDPLFVDPENGDLHLQAESPCIDAGNPDPQYNDGCYPPGLGTERNDMGIYGGPGNCGWDGTTPIESGELSPAGPITSFLSQNYPNPFNSETIISFNLPTAAQISLRIYNTSGRLIRSLVNGHWGVGYHVVRWDGTDDRRCVVSSGAYFYRLETDKGDQAMKRMTLLK